MKTRCFEGKLIYIVYIVYIVPGRLLETVESDSTGGPGRKSSGRGPAGQDQDGECGRIIRKGPGRHLDDLLL